MTLNGVSLALGRLRAAIIAVGQLRNVAPKYLAGIFDQRRRSDPRSYRGRCRRRPIPTGVAPRTADWASGTGGMTLHQHSALERCRPSPNSCRFVEQIGVATRIGHPGTRITRCLGPERPASKGWTWIESARSSSSFSKRDRPGVAGAPFPFCKNRVPQRSKRARVALGVVGAVWCSKIRPAICQIDGTAPSCPGACAR